MKRPAILNNFEYHLASIPPPRGLINVLSGQNNTGNALFLESLQRALDASPVSSHEHFLEPTYLNNNFSSLLLPLANFINATWTMEERMLETLEQLEIPIILISVGIQASSREHLQERGLSSSARRILNLSTKHQTIIGARGKETERFLREIGYDNVTIIGCPSLYYQPIRLKALPPQPRVALNANFDFCTPEQAQQLAKFGVQHASLFMIQTDPLFIKDAYGVTIHQMEQWMNSNDLQSFQRRIRKNIYEKLASSQMPVDQIRQWISEVGRFTFSITEWLQLLENIDLVVGSRYHGTVASLLAGIPALLYTVDLRTEELAEYHGIPHLPIEHLTLDTTLEEMIASLDYSLFTDTLMQRKAEYIEYLNVHGLSLIHD